MYPKACTSHPEFRQMILTRSDEKDRGGSPLQNLLSDTITDQSNDFRMVVCSHKDNVDFILFYNIMIHQVLLSINFQGLFVDFLYIE